MTKCAVWLKDKCKENASLIPTSINIGNHYFHIRFIWFLCLGRSQVQTLSSDSRRRMFLPGCEAAPSTMEQVLQHHRKPPHTGLYLNLASNHHLSRKLSVSELLKSSDNMQTTSACAIYVVRTLPHSPGKYRNRLYS